LAAANFDRATQLLQESLALSRKLGNLEREARDQLWLAAISLRAGRTSEAHDLLCSSFGYIVSSGDIPQLAHTMEVAATIVAELGDELRAARLTGAAQAIRQRLSAPITPIPAGLLEQFLAPHTTPSNDPASGASMAGPPRPGWQCLPVNSQRRAADAIPSQAGACCTARSWI
jgi:hypothetical protein